MSQLPDGQLFTTSALYGTILEGEKAIISDYCVVLAWKLQHLSPRSAGRDLVGGKTWKPLRVVSVSRLGFVGRGGSSWCGGTAAPPMRSEDSRFFCTVAMSNREQSYPYCCCVLDLGHVFKCPATYLSNDKSGTSTSGNKFLCLVQPLWEFNFLIFFFPPFLFFKFKKKETDYHTSNSF